MKDKEHVEWNFPENLQHAMDQKGVDPADFEDWDIVTESQIRKYLSGLAIPNLRTACAMARFLGVTIDELCEE